jgi:putative hemolysin
MTACAFRNTVIVRRHDRPMIIGLPSHTGPQRPHASALGLLRRAPPSETRLLATWARDDEDVRAAQRLRWRVLAQESGVRLRPPPGTPAGLDVDLYDAHCEHLLVHTLATADEPAQLVGTCRVLTAAAARELGGMCVDGGFDLVRLRDLRPRLAELGRVCVDPQWRSGSVVYTFWLALSRFLEDQGLDRLLSCASVPMHDGGHLAANLWRQLQVSCAAPADEQVRPRLPLPVEQLCTGTPVQAPALIRCYLGFGARVMGPPAWNADFGWADLPLMLHLADMPASHRRRTLGH